MLYSLTLSSSKVSIFRRFCSIPTTLSTTHLRVHDLEPVIMLHSLSAPISTLPCPIALRGRNNSSRPYRPILAFSTPAVARSGGGDCHDRFEVEYTPWLVVGLGNPGNKYQGTRHNVGFEMVDRMGRTEGVLLNTIQSKALIGIGCIGEVPIVLAKPQVYMNFIGESVSPLATYYGVPLRHIIVVYDEMGLPNGVMRLQPKGGDGKHNGLKSVMAHLDQRKDVPRLAIGIGSPPGSMDIKAFLLQKFSPAERAQIDEALDQGVEALRTLVLTGFSRSISRFNISQKYKYHKV